MKTPVAAEAPVSARPSILPVTVPSTSPSIGLLVKEKLKDTAWTGAAETRMAAKVVTATKSFLMALIPPTQAVLIRTLRALSASCASQADLTRQGQWQSGSAVGSGTSETGTKVAVSKLITARSIMLGNTPVTDRKLNCGDADINASENANVRYWG